jgi:hypothetical protein
MRRLLRRYVAVIEMFNALNALSEDISVGLCRLNQVYPYPITYSLSNP